jgi:transcriptional regulator with XRE-family HTH domain
VRAAHISQRICPDHLGRAFTLRGPQAKIGIVQRWRIHLTILDINYDVLYIRHMLTPAQLRAARALLGIDQRALAERAGVSLPTIQRMEASDGYVRGVIDTLTKVVAALEEAGIELIGDNTVSTGGGRGVRLREPATPLQREFGPHDTRRRQRTELPA